MKVDVTQDHIDNGVPLDCYQCPVASAVEDALGRRAINQEWIRVGGEAIWLVTHDAGGRHATPYHIPRSVRRFIARFDAGKPVQPFTFILREVTP